MMYQIIWVVLVVAFAVLEGLTAGLVSIWFCVGSLAGVIMASAGASLEVQIIVFAAISLASMILIRPFAKRYVVKKTVNTNADRILDAEAVVTEEIDNMAAKGQIRVLGERWTARAARDDEQIGEGSKVRVLRIEGVKAIVTKEEVE